MTEGDAGLHENKKSTNKEKKKKNHFNFASFEPSMQRDLIKEKTEKKGPKTLNLRTRGTRNFKSKLYFPPLQVSKITGALYYF